MAHGSLPARARAAMASIILGATLLSTAGVPVASAAGCTSTGTLDRDGTPLTARLIDPPGTVRGRIDASGCDVGVYYDRATSRIRGAEIFGARYYGVLADGNDGHVVAVDIIGTAIHDIGDRPYTAVRHGQGVAFRAYGAGSATGMVVGSRIWGFQEAGINFAGNGVTGTARDNVVQGLGPTDVIAQNGIQVNFGARGTVERNTIRDLRFLGPNASSGVLVAGGDIYDSPTRGCLPSGCPYTTGARIIGNTIIDTDTGVAEINADADFNPIPTPSDTLVTRNVIRNDSLTNLEGWDGSIGVQEGVYAYGNRDRILDNVILGRGYDQAYCGAAAVCQPIDTDGAIDPVIARNIVR